MKAFNLLAAGMLALAAVPSAATPGQAPGKPSADTGWNAEAVGLSRSFMIGLWTDDGDCDHAVEFLGDGRYFAGTSAGIWQLDGHELTLTGDNILVIRVVPIDHDTIGVISQDGSVGQSTRCTEESLPLPGPDETV